MQLEPHKAKVIVNCSVFLHNFLKSSRTSRDMYRLSRTFDYSEEVDGQLQFVPGSWRSESQPTTSSLP